jgi:5-oxoprolinase (ATP-hydrolysing)
VRGVVRRRVDGRTLLVEGRWGGVPELVIGFRLRLLPEEPSSATVVGHDPKSGILRFDHSVADPPAGTAFELLSPEEAPVLACRMVMARGAGEPLPPFTMRLATTRGTNALLQRKGAPFALFVTRGFADLPRIGTQQRPDLFALHIRRPPPLAARVVEIPGRLAADGSVLLPLDEEAARAAARATLESGLTAAAIALAHSYRNPEHETRLEAILREEGFDAVSRSSALSPSIGLLHRAETASVDAYLTPVLSEYLQGVQAALPSGSTGGTSRIHVMTSAGGLIRPENFRAKDSLLSGPAGGVVGAAAAGEGCGLQKLIAFDMGGTSTDVSRFDGDFEYVWRHRVGDVDLLAPALAIESVAAGGGSICTLDVQGLRVGPESAGAEPGPACYGAGGPLTITDCNLLLGRLDPSRFDIPLDREAAAAALEALRQRILHETGEDPGFEPLAAGLIDIADERMTDAIRAVSVARGYDPADYALVVFGGAGAQHGSGVARRLGIRSQVVPPEAGLLSAWGLGRAVLERVAERQVLETLGADGPIRRELDRLGEDALQALQAEGVERAESVVRRRVVNLRYAGQESTLPVEVTPDSELREQFQRQHQEVYGHCWADRAVEVESLRVIASTRPRAMPPGDAAQSSAREPARRKRVWVEGEWREIPVMNREDLPPGATFGGPCIVLDPHSSILVESSWTGRVAGSGAIVLERRLETTPTDDSAATSDTRPAVVQEQLFTSRFEALVSEMGEQLRRTAVSTNVKERLDFSCALLDPGGELVASAPHIPVHLGALGLCVRSVAAALPLNPGDVAVTNHPAFGGSHLPDVTVITPVHDHAGVLLGFVANRAHHAEIGGARPGSMPPDARRLSDEGVVIPPLLLVEGGVTRWERLEALLTGGRYPSRTPADNLADLDAQVAANRRGAEMLRKLGTAHGAEAVRRFMDALTGRAERTASEALRRLQGGVFTAEERLDDGSPIRVAIRVDQGGATFDFSGTSDVHPGNLNATPAIVRSALLYVLRLLIDEPLPLNEGLLRRVAIHLPRSLLDPPFPGDPDACPAVVGGNTETSQRLVDTVLKALGVAACSQGTMNNVLWGDSSSGYYETICGGAGAGPGYAGASGVHTHMTNTRITDVEVLEHRFPVRVERFGLRQGSGGAGEWPGGEGVIREITFLRPVRLSVLTQHRSERPYGVHGGEPGAAGRQRVIRFDGSEEVLMPIDGREMGPGDRLIVETPGGGGWGLQSEAENAGA